MGHKGTAMENTLSKLKQQERIARQELIIAAARDLFGRTTYDRVSMAEIARAAGIAKSSIYTYFPSQEALFVEIAWRDTDHFVSALEKQIRSRRGDPLDILVNGFLDYYIPNEAQWRMITNLALNGTGSDVAVERFDAISRRVMDCFEMALRRNAHERMDTRLLAHTLFAALSGILIAFRKYPGRGEADKRHHMRRIGATVKGMFLAVLDGPQPEAPLP
jgi:AcrR family transcriptional regulator